MEEALLDNYSKEAMIKTCIDVKHAYKPFMLNRKHYSNKVIRQVRRLYRICKKVNYRLTHSKPISEKVADLLVAVGEELDYDHSTLATCVMPVWVN